MRMFKEGVDYILNAISTPSYKSEITRVETAVISEAIKAIEVYTAKCRVSKTKSALVLDLRIVIKNKDVKNVTHLFVSAMMAEHAINNLRYSVRDCVSHISLYAGFEENAPAVVIEDI